MTCDKAIFITDAPTCDKADVSAKPSVRSIWDVCPKVAYCLCNLLLPIAILLFASFINGLYPLGSRMFLVADLQMQYVDFYAWLRDVLTGQADFWYSFSQELGGSTIAMVGYYLSSPFNLFLPLFAEDDIAVFCFVITLLKIGFIQLAICFFLKKRFDISSVWASAISLGFSLSVWILTQSRNPMWLDSLIFLPLCALGAYRLVRFGQWRLLAVAYGLCVFTSWYMGYMVGLFLLLYFLFEAYLFSLEDAQACKQVSIRRVLRFCSALLLGICLSAVIFLPSLCSMSDSGTSSGGIVRAENFGDVLASRLPFLAGYSFELVAGVIVVFLAICIFVALFLMRKWKLSKKCAALVFALLSLCLVACLCLPSLQHGNLLAVLGALFCGLWIDSITPQIYGSALLLILSVVFFCLRNVSLQVKIAAALFLYLLFLSTWLYPLQFIWGGMRVPAGYNSRMSFLFVFMLAWCSAYAIGVLLNKSASASSLPTSKSLFAACFSRVFLQLKGILNKPTFAFIVLVIVVFELCMRSAFLWSPAAKIYTDREQSQFDEYMSSAVSQLEELRERDDGIYRVEKLYTRLDEHSLNEGMTLNINQLSSYTSTGDKATMSFLEAFGEANPPFYIFEAPDSLIVDSLLGIKYISSTSTPQGYEDVGLSPIKLPDSARFYENPYALPLAYGASAQVIDFVMPDSDRFSRTNAFASAVWGKDVDVASAQSIDYQRFSQIIDGLREHPFMFEEFGGSKISGSIVSTDNQVLLMTIPNQLGWEVKVNGEKVSPLDVANGALMAIPVEEGDNYVEMRFFPPGFFAGGIISAAALLFLLFSLPIRRSRARDSAILLGKDKQVTI